MVILHPNKVIRKIDVHPLVSIIIPTKDKVEYLGRCINSILNKTTYKNFEIILIDNNSKDKSTLDYYHGVSSHPKIKLLHYPYEFNYSKINNFGVENSDGEVLLFLNNDTEVISEDWIERMLEHVLRKEVGVVGVKLLFPNGKIQHAGVILGLGGVAGHAYYKEPCNTTKYLNMANVIRNYSAVTFACAMMRREVFEEVGGLNESLPFNYNDVDFCLRIKEKGYLIVYTPYSILIHHESVTRVSEVTEYEANYMKSRWKRVIDNDPYYNPNLSRKRSDFGLREKPIPWTP